MKRIQADERFVDRRGVIVTKLAKVKFAKIAVDLIGIASVAVLREVLINDFRIAEIGEAEADDAKRIGYTMLVAFLIFLVEVVADRQAIIEHRDVVVQGLFVEFLFVQSPPLLVQRQLVVGRALAHFDDRAVRVFRVQVLFPDEVVFTAPKIDFIQVSRVRILGD